MCVYLHIYIYEQIHFLNAYFMNFSHAPLFQEAYVLVQQKILVGFG